MNLRPKTRFGRYEIRAQIGAGGMGEVYRAYDPKINRDVAIKVLSTDLPADQEPLKRFEYEAQAAGSLNHPNIVAIYDVDSHEGAPYVVSELLEGETLRSVIQRGPLPTRKAIEHGQQVANGLSAAHAKGIVHRDIKPENLFVTRDGRVKILDFGIAKLIERKAEDEENTNVPTKKFHTSPGIAIGTNGYMSPEQVNGGPVDSRTDIFSFGCVLYEMLSGKRAFQCTSAVETLNAILKEDPAELSSTNSSVGPSLEKVVRHCLEKDPDQRFQSARDVSFALDALSGSTPSSAVTVPQTSQSKVWTWLPWALAALGFISLLASIYFYRFHPSPVDSNNVKFVVYSPPKGSFQWILGSSSAISPDGKKLVMVVTTEGRTQLWLRSLDSPVSQPIAGTEDAVEPFWSPDSHTLAYFAEGRLKRIELTGGSPQTICNVSGRGAVGTWGRDGTILFGTGSIHRVAASGGEPDLVLAANPDDFGYGWPYFLPDGRHFLLVNFGIRKKPEVLIGSTDSKDLVHLLQIDSRAVYAPPGYLLYVKEGALMGQRFDPNKLSLSGEPVVVADGLLYFQPLAFADFSVSDNGVLAYQTGTRVSRLMWFSRDGALLGEVGKPADYSFLRLSPDDQQLAVNISDARTGTTDLWLFDLARNATSHFTSDPRVEWAPIWSPDSKKIVFAADKAAPPFLQLKGINDYGSGEPLNEPSDAAQFPFDWLKNSDGEFILYRDETPTTNGDLLLLPLQGDRKPRPFLQTKFDESEARFSPDGKWVAYISNESGRREVYVRALAGDGQKWKVSTAGGSTPRWRGDGKELYYLGEDGNIFTVAVKPGDAFTAATPEPLFHIQPARTDYAQYDVTRDGRRFIVNVAGEDQKSALTVVLNWTNDSKRN